VEAARPVLSAIQSRLGLDRAHLLASRGPALGADVLELFASLGLVIAEYFGTPETAGIVAMNVNEGTRLGSAGRPFLGLELRAFEDGELRVRGENVSVGTTQDGGWHLLGQKGRLDEDGFLWLTSPKN
jgi:long-chain acyl-CoA synthetase